MKRFLILLSIGCAALGWSQGGHGIVVAVSDHPAQPAALRTMGAPSDAFRLSAMVQRYGLKVPATSQLVRSKATGKAVRDALASVKAQAKSGENVVFAYSGLGTSLSGGRAGLAVFDSVMAKDDADLSMAELVRWAEAIEAKGAKAWFLVDAAWSPLSLGSREFEDLAYRNVTKFFERSGKEAVLDPVYQGPGTFLSASSASGAAYEWKINASDNQYAGAFSTQLVNYALRPMSEGRVPKFQDVLINLASEFRHRSSQGYMPGETIWTNLWSEATPGDATVPSDRASTPFLGLKKASGGSSGAIEKSSKFRLGFEIDLSVKGEEARRNLRETVFPQFAKYVKEKLPTVELVEDYSYRPDRVVRFFPSGKGIGAVLSGSALEPGIKRADEDHATGGTVAQAMEAEFDDRGSRQKFRLSHVIRQLAATQELFMLPEAQTPSWTNPLTLALPAAFVNEQRWSISLNPAEAGLAYVFARADWNGLISLVLPFDAAFGDTFAAAKQPTILPKKSQADFIAYEEAAPPVGRVAVRVLFVDQKALPNGKNVTESLEATLKAIRANSVRWTFADTSYLHKR